MRRWILLASVVLLMAATLPAGAAAPTVIGEVTLDLGDEWSFVRFMPGATSLIARFRTNTTVSCAGLLESSEVAWIGVGTVTNADIDRHMRSGTFSATVAWTPEETSGCTVVDTPSSSLEANFDTGAKAERWREGSTHYVLYTGAGTVDLFSLEHAVGVTVVRAVNH